MPKRERRRPLKDTVKLRWKIFGGVFLCALGIFVVIRAFPPIEIINFVRFHLGKEPIFRRYIVPAVAKPEEHPSAQTRFPITFNNGKIIHARLALTEIERMRGLMGCRKLDEDEGMFFIYHTSEQRAFWMKNVPIDLDIGYFDATGKLLEVYTMRANSTTSTYSKSDDIRFCLEMNRSWFEKNNMLPQNNISVDLDTLRRAVRERGFE